MFKELKQWYATWLMLPTRTRISFFITYTLMWWYALGACRALANAEWFTAAWLFFITELCIRSIENNVLKHRPYCTPVQSVKKPAAPAHKCTCCGREVSKMEDDAIKKLLGDDAPVRVYCARCTHDNLDDML